MMTKQKSDNTNDFSKGYGDIDQVDSENTTIPTKPNDTSDTKKPTPEDK